MPLPSSHAKGCLALVYGEYAFLGDGLYGKVGAGYNVQILFETLKTVKSLGAKYFALSHTKKFVCDGAEAVKTLEELYKAGKGRQFTGENNPFL